MKRVLVLGATGMLGSAVLRYLFNRNEVFVLGSVRATSALRLLPEKLQEQIIGGVDVENVDCLTDLFAKARPDVVINCIGLIKQLAEAGNPLAAIPINSVLPHRLASLCDVAGARLIHISTDCVFSGAKGMYVEADIADARDMYGLTKFLGEVDYPHAITVRTSIIGTELQGAHGLVSWFLAQQGVVKGYSKAIFSGLPTVELARVIHDFVIPNVHLRGVYHVSAAPIDKFALLSLVAKIYEKKIDIVSDSAVVLDRSLDSSRFRKVTGYVPPSWRELITFMRDYQ